MVFPNPASQSAASIALPWIVRLRYWLAAGQLATALAVHYYLAIDLPLRWIAILPILTILSNIALARWASRTDADRPRVLGLNTSHIIASVFVFDTLCLTALLMLTSGPNNPFSLLYLVFITLAATILTKRQTWALGALATLCFAALFGLYRPIPELEMHQMGPGPNLHLIGMWVGFGVAAFLIAMFSGKISGLLREHERSLVNMQEELAKRDRLTSLVTLAAGAAHELSTPLATIAVVAKELERQAALTIGDPSIVKDSQLIRTEVERCREILARMSSNGAEPTGETPEPVALYQLLSEIVASYPDGKLRMKLSTGHRFFKVVLPRRAVQQALSALVKNAIQASPDSGSVTLSAAPGVKILTLRVEDRGLGMSTDILRHVGEPFFTTKEPGQGMGLGVFLVRTLAERLGGSLTYESDQEKGTVAILELPLSGA